MISRLHVLQHRYNVIRARLLVKSNWQEEAVLRFEIIDILAEIRRIQSSTNSSK
jgi:hypothetical protein